MRDSKITRRITRWRLILGEDIQSLENEGQLNKSETVIDEALSFLYNEKNNKNSKGSSSSTYGAGRNISSPKLAKWLDDIRKYFPNEVVSILQRDAIERKGLSQLIFEPETLKNVIPDISMVSTLLELKKHIPKNSKNIARKIVKDLVDDIVKRLKQNIERVVIGSLNRRKNSPLSSTNSIDWKRTIKSNIKNYNVERKHIIPEKVYFFERNKIRKKWHIILDIDQSGSMSESIIYSSIIGSIFASIPVLKTNVVTFDTNVVDLTDVCQNDPVDMLFGMQLGGGTDINKSIAYCQDLIENPQRTLFILISDLDEGGIIEGLMKRLNDMKESGVKVISLLTLSDKGKPKYNKENAKIISDMGIPCFACTPNKLPELVEYAIKGKDLSYFT